MKSALTNQVRLALIASAAVCAIAIGSPSNALAAGVTSTSADAMRHGGNVESRIKDLHDQLKITPAQEAQWSGVAQVMLDNSSAIESAIQDRAQKAKGMSAIDDLLSYQAIAAAHAEGLKKFAAVFAPLYSAMPEAQQKNADAVFAHRTEQSKSRMHS
jgi:periplasmic protein CpxP/Spy